MEDVVRDMPLHSVGDEKKSIRTSLRVFCEKGDC
jgi:hypothetical protein